MNRPTPRAGVSEWLPWVIVIGLGALMVRMLWTSSKERRQGAADQRQKKLQSAQRKAQKLQQAQPLFQSYPQLVAELDKIQAREAARRRGGDASPALPPEEVALIRDRLLAPGGSGGRTIDKQFFNELRAAVINTGGHPAAAGWAQEITPLREQSPTQSLQWLANLATMFPSPEADPTRRCFQPGLGALDRLCFQQMPDGSVRLSYGS